MTIHSQITISHLSDDTHRHVWAMQAAADRQDRTWAKANPQTLSGRRFVTKTLFEWPYDVTPGREELFGKMMAEARQEDLRIRPMVDDCDSQALPRIRRHVMDIMEDMRERTAGDIQVALKHRFDISAGEDYIQKEMTALARGRKLSVCMKGEIQIYVRATKARANAKQGGMRFSPAVCENMRDVLDLLPATSDQVIEQVDVAKTTVKRYMLALEHAGKIRRTTMQGHPNKIVWIVAGGDK